MTDDEETHIFMYIDNVHTETTDCTVNFLKFETHFYFYSQIQYFFWAGKHKMLVRITNREDPDQTA